MDPLKTYTIPFVGLSLGKHLFQYKIDNTFFEQYQNQVIGADFQKVSCDAEVFLDKKTTFFELEIHIKGVATLICDLSNEPFEESLSNQLKLIVKFGPEYNDENDEILIIPHESYQINIAQYLYEAIMLAIPVKKVHPGIKDGTLKSEILDKLHQIEIKDKQTIDPRWDKLNELLTPKKQ